MNLEYDKCEKFRMLRLTLQLTQKEFAQKLGLTREVVAAYETHKLPLSKNALLKIKHTLGIEDEYFESNMTPEEAFERYGVDSTQIITETKVFQGMSNCCLYEGIKNYANDNPIATKISLKSQFLSLIFGLDAKADYCFIKLTDSTNEPYAAKGETLIVLKEGQAENGDFVITYFQKSYIIFQYFVTGIDEAIFKGSNNIEIKLSGTKKEQIKILGIIKQKISTLM